MGYLSSYAWFFSPLTSTGYSCQVLLVQIPIDTIDLAAYFQGPATQRSN